MVHMDIFNESAFELVAMTEGIQKLPNVPSFLGDLGIFGPGEGVETNSVSIEQVGMTLQLIKTTARGTDPVSMKTDKRSARLFEIPRVAASDQLMAAEIQGIRAFGSESDLETVVTKIAQKQQRLLTNHGLTMEMHRLGAIQGILTDADGTTELYNYFTEFGITPPTEIDFDLDATSPTEGDLLNKCKAAKRAAIRALGAAYVPGVRFVWLCGDTFYDQFTAHQDVRQTYKNWEAAANLRGSVGAVFETFRFGEMEWHNYMGTDDNSTVAIGTTKAKLMVLGVPGLYRRINGPGEDFDTVNTIGQPMYANLIRDDKRNQWVQPEIFSYPLHMNTRPEVALSARNT